MKKSVKVRLLCLIVAIVMLSGAVAAVAFLGSPYEILKKAMLDAMTYRNVTEESIRTVTVNGILIEESKTHYIIGDDSSLSYRFDENGDISGYDYSSRKLNLYDAGIFTDDGAQWHCASANVYDYDSFYRTGSFALFEPEDRNSAQLRFIELLFDVLVGDLKNNVTMTSANGIRHIRGTLTDSQVPELVKAGIDILVEQSGSYYSDISDVSFDGKEYVFERIYIEHDVKTVEVWKKNVRPMTSDELESWHNGTFYENTGKEYWDTTCINGTSYLVEGPAECVSEYRVPVTRADYPNNGDPLEVPIKSLVIDYIHGEAEIDMDGNLLYFDIVVTATATDVFGVVNVIDYKAGARFSDFGTSNPVCPIPGAEQLLTAEYIEKHFGNPRTNVYFTLNEDGSIDAGSVTTFNNALNEKYDIDGMNGSDAAAYATPVGDEE